MSNFADDFGEDEDFGLGGNNPGVCLRLKGLRCHDQAYTIYIVFTNRA